MSSGVLSPSGSVIPVREKSPLPSLCVYESDTVSNSFPSEPFVYNEYTKIFSLGKFVLAMVFVALPPVLPAG